MTDNLPGPSNRNFLFYDTEDGTTRVQLLVDGQTVWMPQNAIAELFETSKQNVGQHIKNVLEDSELSEDSVVKNYFTTAADGKNYRTKHYNLDMILAIGYRVRSARGTQFRRWATQTLREYLVKGFVLNDDRLKAAETTFGEDYFDELLERIRDIRASERRFYQKITDIYATASDYNSDAEVSREFFATVQNKLEWAITGMTAAEIIKDRADANQPNMGLQTWKNSPSGKIRKTDVTVAKNYLSQQELSDLNRMVTMYLDYAEDQAKRQQPMTMAQWASKLDAFLTFNDRAVLRNAGKVEKNVADALAIEQYEQFQSAQRRIEATEPTSDFDKFVDEVGKLNPPDDSEDDNA
ncbi:virulence RhuM family protein [Stieleria varia]|uniref:Bro-N domain-containing protein n=1 Tax=Stieleria varia TaxID=2528005 RepID=A0A5C6ATS3_9BACT|nr:virulence RhuM family protein [Stieleria varia]TWU02867.1 hypothetical protein Pla52n_39270 [Stieleria varia]